LTLVLMICGCDDNRALVKLLFMIPGVDENRALKSAVRDGANAEVWPLGTEQIEVEDPRYRALLEFATRDPRYAKSPQKCGPRAILRFVRDLAESGEIDAYNDAKVPEEKWVSLYVKPYSGVYLGFKPMRKDMWTLVRFGLELDIPVAQRCDPETQLDREIREDIFSRVKELGW
jgi:hypothetical protein